MSYDLNMRIWRGDRDGGELGDYTVSVEPGEVVLDGARGRSTWPPPAQAAESAVRRELGERDADALQVETHDGDRVTVRHRDGRSWSVLVHQEERDDLRPESCGKAVLPVRAWRVESATHSTRLTPPGGGR